MVSISVVGSHPAGIRCCGEKLEERFDTGCMVCRVCGMTYLPKDLTKIFRVSIAEIRKLALSIEAELSA